MSGIQQLLLAGGGAAVPVDPYFYSVTSLLHGDGANGGQNNTFLDSSSNNFTITRNGNTTQGSFSPFSQTGWSFYQNPLNDYLNFTTGAGTLFQFTGDYTIEAWVFLPSIGSDTSIWVSNDGSANYHALNIDATNYNIYLNSGGPTSSFSHGITLNAWTHVAMVRSGSTVTLYTNGLSRGTITNSSTNGYASPTLARNGGGAVGSTARYLSNFRIVKGTAVYTAAFTPPTTPLTAISGTSLLTSQANRFLDASSNALVPTVTGSPSVQPFSPFNPITAYSTSAVGGSGYFDGSGDYLTSSIGSIGSGASFTFEFWAYFTGSLTSNVRFFDLNSFAFASQNLVYRLSGLSSGSGVAEVSMNGSQSTSGTSVIQTNTWQHHAVSYNGTTLSVFVNGNRVISYTPTAGSLLTAVAIGSSAAAAEYFTGYMSSFRLVIGTAVYNPASTTLTVPTSPLTAISGTSLLTNFTNGAIFDNAAVADYETVGNAQISTSVKKYGTGSISLDGNGDYLFTPSNQTLAFGTADFTIEFWVYFNAVNTLQVILDFRPNATASSASPDLYLNSDGTLRWFVSGADRITSGALSASTWYHVAICRVASQTKLFVNGTQSGSTYADTTSYLQSGAAFGFNRNNGGSLFYYLNGYIDDLRISNGIGRYPYNFTPPTAEFPNIGGTVTLTADPYFDYTTLLLPGNGTNGAQNNTFLDSSTNAFSITRNGNTTQGTFSPFSQTGWGNYFDGSGDYLQLADSTAWDLSGDFTIEMWLYKTSTASQTFFMLGAGGSTSILMYQNASNVIIFLTSSAVITASTAAQLNTWNHVALVRSGSTITLYLNGTSVGQATNSTSFTGDAANGVRIGAEYPTGFEFTGYISNARIVKGTAVYTSNFTPSTTPLTAITNTSLLTCQSNRFIDNSTNNFAITANGDVSVQAFSPFNPTAAWSAATNGGSGYFDGSGDALYAPANAAFNFGAPSGNTNDFTVEMWVYPLNFSNIYFLYGTGPSGGADQFYLNTDSRAYYFDGSSQISSPVLTANSWNHLALVRNGSGSNNIRVYGNGVSGTAVTSSNSLGSSVNSPYIGSRSDGSYPLPGYISSLRVVKGTAVYTTGFTPPTAPLTAIANTSLLTNYTNAGIYDATSKNDLETVGNAQISTTQSKFGGSSMYFDGTGDYLLSNAATTNLYAFGTGDFTVEMWIRFSAIGTDVYHFYDSRPASTDGAYPTLRTNASSQLEYIANSAVRITGATLTTNTWYHIALSRAGTSTKLFVDGVQSGSTYTDSTNYLNAALRPLVGGSGFHVTTLSLNGYIDDLRVTKGIARYTSNFTPPTTAFLTL